MRNNEHTTFIESHVHRIKTNQNTKENYLFLRISITLVYTVRQRKYQFLENGLNSLERTGLQYF